MDHLRLRRRMTLRETSLQSNCNQVFNVSTFILVQYKRVFERSLFPSYHVIICGLCGFCSLRLVLSCSTSCTPSNCSIMTKSTKRKKERSADFTVRRITPACNLLLIVTSEKAPEVGEGKTSCLKCSWHLLQSSLCVPPLFLISCVCIWQNFSYRLASADYCCDKGYWTAYDKKKTYPRWPDCSYEAL